MPAFRTNTIPHIRLRKQRGAALMVMLVLIVIGSAAFLVSALSSAGLQTERDKITSQALAQAKDSLIGYAVSVQISNSPSVNQPRPGELPCPDNHPAGDPNEGTPSSPCSGNALGRLPWKKLGLPDLRDSSGERLWYSVSSNFKNAPRSGTLNSETLGTLSVFSTNGTLLNDGGNNTGVVAVIIAPGNTIQRQGGTQQDRSIAGYNIASNYLDIATLGGLTADNANFTDGSSTNGFILGPIKDSNGNLIVNDQMSIITQDNIMQVTQKRVAGEVKQCLNEYALTYYGRYPWAAAVSDLSTLKNDIQDEYFGRISDDLTNSNINIALPNSDRWGPLCMTHNTTTPATWWKNWKELVFYGLSKNFKPDSFNAPSFPATCATAGSCLSINNSATPAKFVVIVAGKQLATPDQSSRNTNKNNAFYYLEGGNESANQSGSFTFIQNAPSTTFNDTVIYQ